MHDNLLSINRHKQNARRHKKDPSICEEVGRQEAFSKTELDISDHFLQDVWAGLASTPKTLPCKYFYDEIGSQLFTEICEQPEYYITQTELTILRRHLPELVQLIGPDAGIIEPGSGAGEKIQLLLAQLETPRFYVPMDISVEILEEASAVIARRFPNITIVPQLADFNQELSLPDSLQTAQQKNLVFFPGSTIGNFTPEAAQNLLRRFAKMVGNKGALLIGVDTVKAVHLLLAAYNDQAGVTARFNLHLLERINEELGGDFDCKAYRHMVRFDDEKSRMEMHIESQKAQKVNIQGRVFSFAAGECIHTENSYKYSIKSFHALARAAGWVPQTYWQDDKKLFSVHYLTTS